MLAILGDTWHKIELVFMTKAMLSETTQVQISQMISSYNVDTCENTSKMKIGSIN